MFKFLFILGFVLSPFGFSGWSSTVAYASHKGVGSSEGHYCRTKYSTIWSTMQERVDYIYRQKRKYCHRRATHSYTDSCVRTVKPCLEWLDTACGADPCKETVTSVTLNADSAKNLSEFDRLYLLDE